MRIVNGVDFLGSAGRKNQTRGSTIVTSGARQNFAALAEQVVQKRSLSGSNIGPRNVVSASAVKNSNGLDVTKPGDISAKEISFFTSITDPFNNFNDIANSDYIKKLQERDWYDKNNLRIESGNSWENSFKNVKGSIDSFYNQIVASGRATPEITDRYQTAVAKLDAHEKERMEGKEFPPPESFNRVLRSDIPLSKEEIRNRIAEALKRPVGVMSGLTRAE